MLVQTALQICSNQIYSTQQNLPLSAASPSSVGSDSAPPLLPRQQPTGPQVEVGVASWHVSADLPSAAAVVSELGPPEISHTAAAAAVAEKYESGAAVAV